MTGQGQANGREKKVQNKPTSPDLNNYKQAKSGKGKKKSCQFICTCKEFARLNSKSTQYKSNEQVRSCMHVPIGTEPCYSIKLSSWLTWVFLFLPFAFPVFLCVF